MVLQQPGVQIIDLGEHTLKVEFTGGVLAAALAHPAARLRVSQELTAIRAKASTSPVSAR